MKILIKSIDDPFRTELGGKHIHQLLLEKGLKELKQDIDTEYYNLNFFNKIIYGMLKILRISKIKLFKYSTEKMSKYFSKTGYDIINAHDVVAANKKNIDEKLVLTLHGYFGREALGYDKYSSEEEKSIANYSYGIEKKAIENADRIVAVDNRIKDYVVEKFNYDSNKIDVIFNAVDTSTFSEPSDKEIYKLREKYEIPQDKFVVLVPRRYVRKNGCIYAAKALKEIRNEKIFMIFAGGGIEKENIIKELNGDSRARVLDGIPHNQIVDLYKLSNVILVPSIIVDGIEEATSLSMLEGMSCSKVVICSNIGGMKEVIKNNENGLLVEEKNYFQIAKEIEKLILNMTDYKRISKNSSVYVRANHSYLEHAKEILKVYNKIYRG